MSDENRKALVPARRSQTIEMIKAIGGAFDPDFYHVVERRDDELIKNEILYGAGSSTFVYNFEVGGKQVAGVSVIGARHLAAHYGGLKHHIIASVQKTGALFTFTSYPSAGQPMQVSATVIRDLEEEPDYYEALVQVDDSKTGNSIQVQRREMKYEKRRDQSLFERPHYATIAQSKAYRNAILALIDQSIVQKWKENMLKLNKNETVTESVLDQKRAAVIQFAAAKAITLQRDAVNDLTMDQIAGLADAAREGKVPAFAHAAQALGLTQGTLAPPEETPAPKDAPKPAVAPQEAPAPTSAEPQGEVKATRKKKAVEPAAAEPEPQKQAAPEPTPAAPKPAETPAAPQAEPVAAVRKNIF